MKKVPVSDIALRVFLSLALVVSFIPIARDASYAAEDYAASIEAVNADASTRGDTDSFEADTAGGEGDSAAGAYSAFEGDSDSDSAGGETDADKAQPGGSGDADASDSSTAQGVSAGAAQARPICEYGKLMPDGSVYECDESGNLKESIDESDSKSHSVNPWEVKNLIVDSQATSIPERLCYSSTYLQSVRFEGKALKSIGEYAFFDCENFSSISLSGMHIESIGRDAFSYCEKLTSLTIEETATIESIGSNCFYGSGLISTGLDHVEGLKSIPVGAYQECHDLADTGLAGNRSVESVGDSAFAHCHSLVDTGFGTNTHVSSVGEYAFMRCEKLSQTGLATNTRIASIGAYAFLGCKSLRLSGLETNTTVSSLGEHCFEEADMSGGLVLPRGSKITMLPKYAFAKTKLSFVYFQCDHAVLVNSQTFPNGFIKVLVPARSLDLYQNSEVKRDWEACNYDLPYDASNYLSISVVSDPNKLVYQKGDAVSLSGMQVKFNYDGTQHTFDYADLASNYAFSRFFSFSPDNESTFQTSDNGAPVRVTYNDGDHLRSAYSSGLLKEEGNTAFSVYVKSPTAQLGETAAGGGQFALGDTCTVRAETTLDGRLFAYWADEEGNVLSEKETYKFTVERSIVLTAVFADEIVVSPKARLNLANGSEVENATFSIVSDNCNYGETFATYPGKVVTITCNYDSSKWSIDHWAYSDGAYLIVGSENSATVSYTVEGKGDPVAILREKEQPDPDPGKPIDPVVAMHVDYSQTIDLGGRALMEGVEVPNVSGSRFLFAGQFVALDAERLGMLDDDIEFVGWYDKETGACLSERRVCLFKPEMNMSIEARFALKDVAVHVNPAKSTDASESYAHVTPTTTNCYRSPGETVALDATADNAQFRGWYEGEGDATTLISDSLTCDYTVPNFDGQTQVEITPWYCATQASVVLSVDGTTEDGSPQGSFVTTGLYGIGSHVTVVAIPAPYYVLDYVTDAAGNKVPVAENGSYTFTLEGDTQLTAHFRETSDGHEAFIALQAALIAALGVAIVASTAGGFGEFVDPIAIPAIIEVGEAETIEDLVKVGGKALKEIEEIFEHHKHDRDPDKPKGDHTAEIIATAQPEAGGIVKGGGVHFEGTVAELDAIANPGYRFVCWKEDGIERSTLPHMQMAITDVTPDIVKLTAVFEKEETVTTSIEVEGAAADVVTGCNAVPDRQVVRHGAEATVVATAGEGYDFVGWFEGVAEVSKSPTYTFVAETDRHLTAKFNRKCQVTVKVEPQVELAGKCTVTGDGVCVVGKPTVLSASLSADVREKYTFKGWYRGETDVLMGTDESHLELIPDGDTLVRAVYVVKKCEIGVEIGGFLPGINPHGEVEIMGYPGMSSIEVPYGRHVTIKATPNDKYWFAYWEDSSGKHYPEAELRVCVTKNETYTAVFKKGPDVIITADAYWGGKVTCNGEEVKPDTDKYALDETLHLAAEPNPGFLFWGWYENGILMSTERECTLVAQASAISGKCAIVAAFKPLDVVCLPVASPSEGGMVTASRLFADRGSDVALKATAAPGYAFVGWYTASGELESMEPEFTCREERSHIHVAHFKEQAFTVAATAVTADEEGALVENADAGWVEGAGDIGAGRTATLTAHAREGYVFKRWVDDKGATLSTDAEYHFVPWENATLRAVFEPRQFTVAANVAEGFGTVEGAGTYAAGQTATVTATPNMGASFIGWYSEGICVSTSATYSFTVCGDVTLTAVFGTGSYVVSAIASPADAGYTSGFGAFGKDDRTTLIAVAKPGYTFDCWKDAQGNVISALPEVTVAVSDNAAYVAFFTRDSYRVSLSASPEGAGALKGEGTYCFGDTVELNAQPTSGKRFTGWYVVAPEDEKPDEGSQAAGATASGLGSDDAATLLSKDAHCWLTLDEGLLSDIDNGELCLRACFADPYEVSVAAKAVVAGKMGSRGCKVRGTGAYSSGDKVTLQAVAGEGYRFVGWSLDEAGDVIANSSPIWEFEANADVVYYAQFAADKPVEVSVTQSSIFRGLVFMTGSFGVGTSAEVDAGDPFVAMAVPFPGVHFSHWIDDAGAIVSYSAIHVGLARENTRLTAIFYETGFDAQVATYPEGAGFSMVIPGTGTSYNSASVMITIPYPGWKFKCWIDETGAPVGFSPVMPRPAYANRTFTAYYVKETIEVVAIDPREGGCVAGSINYTEGGYALVNEVEPGSAVTLSAEPYDGYEFVGWYDYADRESKVAQPLSTDATWTFYPEADAKVVPRFKEVPKYTVTAEAEGGTVDPASVDVIPGGSASFTATPSKNCYLDRVSTASAEAADAAANLDISDYGGGPYQLILKNVNASLGLNFAFVQADAPAINAQPQNASVHEGESATLSISADAAQSVRDHEAASSGAAASHELSYQWFRVEGDKLAEAVEGATKETLTVSYADAGTYYCRVTQSYLGTTTKAYSGNATVSQAKPEVLVFNSAALPVATAHDGYRATIPSATGGTAPYTYALAEGSKLPEGISFAIGGTGDLLLSGTAKAAGVYGFDIVCTDSPNARQQTAKAHFTIVVKPKKVELALSGDSFVYSGKPQGPSLAGVSTDLESFVSYTYIGTGETHYSSSTPPTDAGTYRVKATLNKDDYVGFATAKFSISRKFVDFEIIAENAEYDGKAHGVSVNAPGLSDSDYAITYRGANGTKYGPSNRAPIDAGSYTATASTTSPNLSGSKSESYTISRASQKIEGKTEYSATYGSTGIVFENTAMTPITFKVVADEDGAPSPIAIQGSYAAITSAGTARVVAHAAASRNYEAAEDVELTVTVSPAPLLVVVHDAERFAGEENPAFTSTLVSPAPTTGVSVAYSCDADKSSPAGTYEIGANVSNPNFETTVNPGTLIVKERDPIDPVGPDNPDKPDDPSDPSKPDNPPTPDDPAGPVDPDNPTGPTDPDNPSDPSEPADPDNPAAPDNPGGKDNPDQPVSPNSPGRDLQPGSSWGSGSSSGPIGVGSDSNAEGAAPADAATSPDSADASADVVQPAMALTVEEETSPSHASAVLALALGGCAAIVAAALVIRSIRRRRK